MPSWFFFFFLQHSLASWKSWNKNATKTPLLYHHQSPASVMYSSDAPIATCLCLVTQSPAWGLTPQPDLALDLPGDHWTVWHSSSSLGLISSLWASLMIRTFCCPCWHHQHCPTWSHAWQWISLLREHTACLFPDTSVINFHKSKHNLGRAVQKMHV